MAYGAPGNKERSDRLFTFSAAERVKLGSLFTPEELDQILQRASMDEEPLSRDELRQLRTIEATLGYRLVDNVDTDKGVIGARADIDFDINLRRKQTRGLIAFGIACAIGCGLALEKYFEMTSKSPTTVTKVNGKE